MQFGRTLLRQPNPRLLCTTTVLHFESTACCTRVCRKIDDDQRKILLQGSILRLGVHGAARAASHGASLWYDTRSICTSIGGKGPCGETKVCVCVG